ncbi:MAG: hypothetical protein JWO72_812, partial [Caulobacteraceae bacterium]|nr:hypothetical protein [Caulobacteraceae bacterium]
MKAAVLVLLAAMSAQPVLAQQLTRDELLEAL